MEGLEYLHILVFGRKNVSHVLLYMDPTVIWAHSAIFSEGIKKKESTSVLGYIRESLTKSAIQKIWSSHCTIYWKGYSIIPVNFYIVQLITKARSMIKCSKVVKHKQLEGLRRQAHKGIALHRTIREILSLWIFEWIGILQMGIILIDSLE